MNNFQRPQTLAETLLGSVSMSTRQELQKQQDGSRTGWWGRKAQRSTWKATKTANLSVLTGIYFPQRVVQEKSLLLSGNLPFSGIFLKRKLSRS